MVANFLSHNAEQLFSFVKVFRWIKIVSLEDVFFSISRNGIRNPVPYVFVGSTAELLVTEYGAPGHMIVRSQSYINIRIFAALCAPTVSMSIFALAF